jgi:hypothetical protein
MLVDPLADVEVNVPGVMEMFVAPVAAQVRALLAPAFMLAGLAVNEVMVGADPLPGPVPDPVPEDDPDVVPAVQPIKPLQKPIQTNKVRASAEQCRRKWLFPETHSFVPQYELGVAICSPFAGDGYKSLPGGDLVCLLTASTESGRRSSCGSDSSKTTILVILSEAKNLSSI